MIVFIEALIISIGKFFIQEIRSLHRRFFPMPLTEAEKLFIKENSAFWSKNANSCQGNRYVLIEFNAHPVIYLSNASFGSIVAHSRGLKPLFVLQNSENTSQRHILSSYPNAASVYLTDWRFLVPMIKAWLEAIRAYRSLQSPKDLLELKVDGMPVGDIVYDVVLAYGYATIQVIDKKVFRALYSFFQIRYAIKGIIRRYEIETAVLSQLMGVRGGAFAKYLLQGGIEVLNRGGSHHIILQRNRTLDNMRNHFLTPLPEYVSLMMDNDDGTAQRFAEEYLEQRVGGKIASMATDLAFNPTKKTFTDRQSFCAEYHLDHRKPIVFVMLHAFNDWPHWNYPKKMLFLDYYHWFMATLEIARTVQSVNWIFKEHPTQRLYPTKDLDLNVTMKRVNCSHIRFLDGQADFNSGSLRYIAHAVVTGMGTAGLEFAVYGIPCVLTGEGSYSGFGFTIEPNNVEEYENCLKHINHLQPLNSEQIKAAKIVAFFYFCRWDSQTYYFCPRFEDDEISEWRPEYAEKLWEKAAAHFQDLQYVKKMRRQVKELARFICDDSWIQYVDLNQFPFLRRAIHMAGIYSHAERFVSFSDRLL